MQEIKYIGKARKSKPDIIYYLLYFLIKPAISEYVQVKQNAERMPNIIGSSDFQQVT